MTTVKWPAMLLARLSKRVLRPGGAELTSSLLARVRIGGADVVELAIGRGLTARQVLKEHPSSYVGVDSNADAVSAAGRVIARQGNIIVADAAATGLPGGCPDLVAGEAMLTMQGERTKHRIIAEAVRLLRPGGRYAIHELGLTPDTIDDGTKDEVRGAFARSVKVNAWPQTVAEWRTLLVRHGVSIDYIAPAPMAFLQLRRIISDEGVPGALCFAWGLLTHPDARRRVLAMRRTFAAHRADLLAVSIIAPKPLSGPTIPFGVDRCDYPPVVHLGQRRTCAVSRQWNAVRNKDHVLCSCGHPYHAHQHFRPGSDCAVCDCVRFRQVTWWRDKQKGTDPAR